MTGYEAAIQEDVDAAVRCWGEAIQARNDNDFRQRWFDQSMKDIIERHSQRDDPLLPPNKPPPSYQPLPSPSLPSPNVMSSSESDNEGEPAENLRPRRGINAVSEAGRELRIHAELF